MLRLTPMHTYMLGAIQLDKTHPPEGRSVAFLIPIHCSVAFHLPTPLASPSRWHRKQPREPKSDRG